MEKEIAIRLEGVNLSAPRPEGRGLLKVHPEARFLALPLKRRGFA